MNETLSRQTLFHINANNEYKNVVKYIGSKIVSVHIFHEFFKRIKFVKKMLDKRQKYDILIFLC